MPASSPWPRGAALGYRLPPHQWLYYGVVVLVTRIGYRRGRKAGVIHAAGP